MKNSKAECFRKRDNKYKSTKVRNLSKNHCEDALETLQEIVDAGASLQTWFDKGLDLRHGSLVDTQLANFPRFVALRSQDTQTTDSRPMSKREAKIVAMGMAVSALLAAGVADNKQRKERDRMKLPGFLKSPFLE